MSNIFLDSINKNDISNESLNDMNDITRMAYKNDSRSNIPIKTNQDRFENDIIISHTESFETNNTRINSLNEEIRELKQKLKVIHEKDEKIYKQAQEIDTLKKELEGYHELKGDNILLKKENEVFEEELIRKEDIIRSLTEKTESIKEKQLTESEERIQEKGTVDEKIKIDIVQFKDVLYKRLKVYHEKHINDLIHTYELNHKSEIDKITMQKILLEAIHI